VSVNACVQGVGAGVHLQTHTHMHRTKDRGEGGEGGMREERETERLTEREFVTGKYWMCGIGHLHNTHTHTHRKVLDVWRRAHESRRALEKH